MKNFERVIFIFLLLFMGLSCKKLETCSYDISYYNPSISLVGFSESAIKTTCILTYKANTNFTELVSTDSLANVPIVFRNDTALYSVDTLNGDFRGFKNVSVGFDYKIQCNQNGKTFLITNVEYGPDHHTWESEHCSPGSSQHRWSPVSFMVNGKVAYPGAVVGFLIQYEDILFLAN